MIVAQGYSVIPIIDPDCFPTLFSIIWIYQIEHHLFTQVVLRPHIPYTVKKMLTSLRCVSVNGWYLPGSAHPLMGQSPAQLHQAGQWALHSDRLALSQARHVPYTTLPRHRNSPPQGKQSEADLIGK
jgi:hypothetical protein